jgi:hypothetical protein
MPLIDYKAKYKDLKTKYLETVDLAWRLGYEQGLKDSQLDQAQQALAQPQMDPNAQPGMPGQEEVEGASSEAQPGEESAAPSNNPNQDELGDHIEKLEGMLGKSEISSLDLQDLKKTLNDIRSLQVSINLTKTMESAKHAKLAKSYTFSPKTKANLPPVAQKALNTQEEILKSVFQKWENESKQASNDISSILGIEGITKKD